MNKDQVKGAVKEVAGKVQGKLGDVTGNTTQKVKGLVNEAAGKAQKKVGDLKEAIADSSKKI